MKIQSCPTGHSNVLEAGHQFAVKAAERVARKETVPALSQVFVDLLQLGEQRVLRRFVLLEQHQLEFLLQHHTT